MFDPFLLSRFLVVAHAVTAAGLGAWYFGLIPRAAPERRFLPLGLYQALVVLTEGVRWTAFYSPGAEAILTWLRPVALTLAGVLLFVAYRFHRRHPPIVETWSLKVRICQGVHFCLAFVVPVLQSEQTGALDRLVPTALAVIALVWLVLSSLSELRRQGHFLHWSMVLAVVGCQGLGWIAMAQVREQGLNSRDEEMRSRAETFAQLLDPAQLTIALQNQRPAVRLRANLETMCSNSTAVTGAFILPAAGSDNTFLSRAVSPAKQPVPVMASAATYAAFANPRAAIAARFTDLEDGERWHVAIAPVFDPANGRVLAYVGLLAPLALLDLSLADSMIVTDSIVFLVALVVYGCIAGYLHGVVRVWQRDILLEINAEHSQLLLQTTAPHDVAAWLIRKMQRRLNLLHASFWVFSARNGVLGFRTLATEPSHRLRGSSQWHPLSELPPSWQSALSRGQSIEGNLNELGAPWPEIVPSTYSAPWVFVENIAANGAPYGAIVAIFPDSNLVARGEIRSALRSITNAFASFIVREQRSEHLAAAEERLRTIIETSPDGFWDADYTRDQYYRSDRWWQMLGHEPPKDSSDRHAFEELIEPDDLEHLRTDAIELLAPGRKFRRREYRARHRDGSWRWIESNTVELRTVHGPAERALGFDRDVTHRHQYEERLREAAESAARANRAKSEFLATMNHELRTPLNSVIGFATILDRSPLNASQRDWVSSMRTSAEQLLGLISDVLDFSRIEAGRLELELMPFELRRATEQALEHFSRLATEKEIALHHEFDDGGHPSWVIGDALRLRQILTNLVGNALKFTQTGFVRLSTRTLAHDQWEFSVEDTGPGIPADRIGALFNRFSQLDASNTRAHGGTGLGLAISRELARAMHGDITVESSEGEGSIFTVTLTLPPAEGERRRYTDTEVSLGITLAVFQPDAHDLSALANALENTDTTLLRCETLDDILAFARTQTQPTTVVFPRAFRAEACAVARQLSAALSAGHAPLVRLGIQAAPPEPGQTSPYDNELSAPMRRRDLINVVDLHRRSGRVLPATSKPPFAASPDDDAADSDIRVLVAEDHPVNRDVVKTMLDQLGVQADFAVNGQAAIEMLAAKPYDIALVDIQMPIVDGFGVARWVRREWTPDWSPPKLVAVTANATHGDRERCLEAGMDEYVAKPVTFTTLTELLRQASCLDPEVARKGLEANMIPPEPTSSAAAAGDHLIDWPSFESILTFTSAAENPEVLRRIIRTFRADMDKLLAEVDEIPADDHVATRRLLHKLKGSTGSLALMGVVDTIKKLHDPQEAPDPQFRAATLRQIRTESELALQAIYSRYRWLGDTK